MHEDSLCYPTADINGNNYLKFANNWRNFCISGTRSDYIKAYLEIRGKFLRIIIGPGRLQASFLLEPGVGTQRKKY
jgi:hypothetical protein